MQSGGAINKEEEARFDRTLPRLTDKKEIQRKKILDQRAEMLSRLHTLGFTPEQAKYAPVDFKYGSDDSQVSSASAGSKPKTVNQNGHTYILNEKTGQYE